MDLRGAGTLLGEEQSGYINAVGLFQVLLKRATEAMHSGHPLLSPWAAHLMAGVDAYIPPHYIPRANTRLQLYSKISSGGLTANDVGRVQKRYGPFPRSFRNLVRIAALARSLALMVEAGHRGATVRLHTGLQSEGHQLQRATVARLLARGYRASMKQDGDILVRGVWPSAETRLLAIERIISVLARAIAKPSGDQSRRARERLAAVAISSTSAIAFDRHHITA